MRRISLIIIHCSASRCNRRYTFGQCRRDHIIANGWKDIGYHYYVETDGGVYKGRDESVAGAHCRNHNRHSIGVCYEGGIDAAGRPADTRTPQQRAALKSLVEKLHKAYPQAMILGHRDLSPDLNGDGRITPGEYIRHCPCFDAATEYAGCQPHGPGGDPPPER